MQIVILWFGTLRGSEWVKEPWIARNSIQRLPRLWYQGPHLWTFTTTALSPWSRDPSSCNTGAGSPPSNGDVNLGFGATNKAKTCGWSLPTESILRSFETPEIASGFLNLLPPHPGNSRHRLKRETSDLDRFGVLVWSMAVRTRLVQAKSICGSKTPRGLEFRSKSGAFGVATWLRIRGWGKQRRCQAALGPRQRSVRSEKFWEWQGHDTWFD